MSLVTQTQNGAKQKVVVYGQVYMLKKDATDAATAFPHHRVKVEEYGCIPVDTNVHMAWISGIIPATPGTLEKSLRVFYVGWSPVAISKPTDRDILNMHVYAAETGPFAQEFAAQFLAPAVEAYEADRPAVTPFPQAGPEVVPVPAPVDIANGEVIS